MNLPLDNNEDESDLKAKRGFFGHIPLDPANTRDEIMCRQLVARSGDLESHWAY